MMLDDTIGRRLKLRALAYAELDQSGSSYTDSIDLEEYLNDYSPDGDRPSMFLPHQRKQCSVSLAKTVSSIRSDKPTRSC